MIVVLDSNVLRDNSAMIGPAFTALKALAAMPESEVVIPEVVLDEVASHVFEEVASIEKSIERFRKTSAFSAEIRWLDHDTLSVGEVRDALRGRFEAAGFTIEPYPDVRHEDVVSRLHTGTKPFGRESPEVGYRDYLIWRSTLGIAERGPTLLVSSNSRDFGRNGILHPELAAEAGHRAIELRPNLHAVVENDIRGVLEGAGGYLAWFNQWVAGPEFVDFLGQALPDSNQLAPVDADTWGLPAELDEWRAERIGRVRHTLVGPISRTGDELIVRVTVVGDAWFVHDIDPGFAYYLEEHEDEYWNAPTVHMGYKERWATAEVVLPGTATFEIQASVGEGPPEPHSVEIAEFSDSIGVPDAE